MKNDYRVIPKEHKLTIGINGELIIPKEIIEFLGFHKEQELIISVVKGTINIRKFKSYEEILKQPAKVKITKDEWKKFKDELNSELLE